MIKVMKTKNFQLVVMVMFDFLIPKLETSVITTQTSTNTEESSIETPKNLTQSESESSETSSESASNENEETLGLEISMNKTRRKKSPIVMEKAETVNYVDDTTVELKKDNSSDNEDSGSANSYEEAKTKESSTEITKKYNTKVKLENNTVVTINKYDSRRMIKIKNTITTPFPSVSNTFPSSTTVKSTEVQILTEKPNTKEKKETSIPPSTILAETESERESLEPSESYFPSKTKEELKIIEHETLESTKTVKIVTKTVTKAHESKATDTTDIGDALFETGELEKMTPKREKTKRKRTTISTERSIPKRVKSTVKMVTKNLMKAHESIETDTTNFEDALFEIEELERGTPKRVKAKRKRKTISTERSIPKRIKSKRKKTTMLENFTPKRLRSKRKRTTMPAVEIKIPLRWANSMDELIGNKKSRRDSITNLTGQSVTSKDNTSQAKTDIGLSLKSNTVVEKLVSTQNTINDYSPENVSQNGDINSTDTESPNSENYQNNRENPLKATIAENNHSRNLHQQFAKANYTESSSGLSTSSTLDATELTNTIDNPETSMASELTTEYSLTTATPKESGADQTTTGVPDSSVNIPGPLLVTASGMKDQREWMEVMQRLGYRSEFRRDVNPEDRKDTYGRQGGVNVPDRPDRPDQDGMDDPGQKKNKTATSPTTPFTTPVRLTFEEDCDYIAYYCMRAYRTGPLCARTMFYVYNDFANYCMLDYVNCMERYEVWQVVHMGECFEVDLLKDYKHYPYENDYFLDRDFLLEN